MPEGTSPLILTLWLDGETFARLDDLRRRHFPPERNLVPAHLTLFHALPGDRRAEFARELTALAARQPAFDLEATGFRSLGRGVALAFSAPAVVGLRQEMARTWSEHLTAQDQARIAPHVTVQNKVAPDVARRTLGELQATFRPFAARGEGLLLWTYLSGPWRLERRFRFTGR